MILADDIGSIVGLGILISAVISLAVIALINTFTKGGSLTQRLVFSIMIFVVVTIAIFALFINLIGYF
jgi:hypothetical protein